MRDIRYERDGNVVVVTFDREGGSANLMDQRFQEDYVELAGKLSDEEDLAGVIFTSAKKTFFAGADLDVLSSVGPGQAEDFFENGERLKAAMRDIETLGVPVVACLAGAALGGGWEMALVAHYRVCMNHPKIRLGLPEVTLGLLPGAGGVTRMTRFLGLEEALPLLLEGRQFGPSQAFEMGLVHKLCDAPEQMLEAAHTFIKENPEASQPWDQKGYRMPGGTPNTPKVAQMLAIAPAMLFGKTQGCYPAPEAILSVAVEGALVDVDTALRIETRYFTKLVTGQVSKNMIRAFWHQMNKIKKGASRPKEVAPQPVRKLGILGAGMMGAGIAYSSAIRGIEVVLKDVTMEGALKGKAYSEKLLAKRLAKGKSTEEKNQQILDRITPADALEGFGDCDLVIEAVFENLELKHSVTRETEAAMSESAVFGSNTSTLPITGLAAASVRPDQFVGIHFFSPVDKMMLVEIICGEKTSDETLARAYDYVLQIGKTPIVVNDSRGFFTSRVIATYINEGIAMLAEGVPAATIEHAAALVGFPVGPLAISDEISMLLFQKVRQESKKAIEAAGGEYPDHPAFAVVDRFVDDLDRPGKLHGKGFYEYSEKGKRLWPGLAEQYPPTSELSLQEVKDRLLFQMPLETTRCFDEGVLMSAVDANLGSILGIGFPAWTGGAVQFMEQYPVDAFISRADELAERYGDRFEVPDSLRQARSGAKMFETNN